MPHVTGSLRLAVAVLLAAPLFYGCTDDPEPKVETFKEYGVEVTATIDGGEVTAEQASAGPAPSYVQVKSTPVHLDTGGGKLVGSATVSLTVDPAHLPAGVDPAKSSLAIYTRESADQPWKFAGGKYDQVTRKISVTTKHFSDWVYGLTNFDAIAREKAQNDKDSVGFTLARSVAGHVPPLDCDPEQIPLGVGVQGPIGSNLNLCATVDPKTEDYHIHVVNKSAVPFRFSMPKGWEFDPDEQAADDVALDLLTALHRAADDNFVILGPEGEVKLTAEKGTVPRNTKVSAHVAYEYAVIDVALGMIDIVSRPMGRMMRNEMQGIAKNPKLQKALEEKGKLDCIMKAADDLSAWLEEKSLNSVSGVKDLLSISQDAIGCLTDILSPIADAALDQMADTVEGEGNSPWDWVKHHASNLIEFGKESADLLDYLNGMADTYRQYLGVALAGTGQAVGAGAAGIAVRTKSPLPKTWAALLPYDKGDDQRSMLPIGAGYGIACEAAVDAENMVLDEETMRDIPEIAMQSAVTRYTPTMSKVPDGSIYVVLMRIREGRTEQARAKLEALPADCTGKLSEGDPAPTTYQPIWPVPEQAQVKKTYATVGPQVSSPPQGIGFETFAISGRWLIGVTMTYSGDEAPNMKAFEQEVSVLGRRLDEALGTNFVVTG